MKIKSKIVQNFLILYENDSDTNVKKNPQNGLNGKRNVLVVPRDENVGEEGDEEIIPALADALFTAEENCVGNTCTLPATQHLQIRVI
mgnify:CR=1 FL=1